MAKFREVLSRLHAWWPIQVAGLVSLVTGLSGWGVAKWAFEKVPSWGRGVATWTLMHPDIARLAIMIVGVALLAVGTFGPRILALRRHKENELNRHKENEQREPTAVQPELKEPKAWIKFGEGTKGHKITDNLAIGNRPFLEAGDGAADYVIARNQLHESLPGQPTRWSAKPLGDQQLKQETLALVRELDAHVAVGPSPTGRSFGERREETEATKRATDEQEISRLFGGRVRHLATQYVRQGFISYRDARRLERNAAGRTESKKWHVSLKR